MFETQLCCYVTLKVAFDEHAEMVFVLYDYLCV